MIGDLMSLTNNYFEKFYINGTITITDGKLNLPSQFVEGQYIRIINSLLNDGVYKIQEKSGETATLSSILSDETFSGFVVGLAVPKSFEELSSEIDAWSSRNKNRRGLTSESSLGGYYSWSASATNVASAFVNEISAWKKLNTGNTTDFVKWARCINANRN